MADGQRTAFVMVCNKDGSLMMLKQRKNKVGREHHDVMAFTIFQSIAFPLHACHQADGSLCAAVWAEAK